MWFENVDSVCPPPRGPNIWFKPLSIKASKSLRDYLTLLLVWERTWGPGKGLWPWLSGPRASCPPAAWPCHTLPQHAIGYLPGKGGDGWDGNGPSQGAWITYFSCWKVFQLKNVEGKGGKWSVSFLSHAVLPLSPISEPAYWFPGIQCVCTGGVGRDRTAASGPHRAWIKFFLSWMGSPHVSSSLTPTSSRKN